MFLILPSLKCFNYRLPASKEVEESLRRYVAAQKSLWTVMTIDLMSEM